MGFAEIQVIRPPSYPILHFTLVGVVNSIRLKHNVAQIVQCAPEAAEILSQYGAEKHREIASQLSLNFFVLWTHVFSLLAHREFWYMPSSPRGSVRPIFPMRWTFFRDCVTFVNFCTLNWSQDFVLFRGLHEDVGGSSSRSILNQLSYIFNVAPEF